MHTLEPELRRLQAEGLIDGATAARLLAADRRDVVSVQPELRLAMYAGVLLLVSGDNGRGWRRSIRWGRGEREFLK